MMVARAPFENLRVYNLAEEFGEMCWSIVHCWDNFARDTLGKQLVRCADSIGANIAEGCGRHSFAENKRFARIARGSLYEAKHWLRSAYKRKLLSPDNVPHLQKIMDELLPKLNAYINSIGTRKPMED